MKKIYSILLILSLLIFSACSIKETTQSQSINIDNYIAYKLEQLDNNYNNETLKALSLIIRTNEKLKPSNTNNNYPISQKYKDIVTQTENELIKTNGNFEYINISEKENIWTQTIKKDKLLNFALKNNISLSNIKTIEPVYLNNSLQGIKVGGIMFDYKALTKEFDLKSDKITNITTNKQEIIITGKDFNNFKYFNIEKSEQLANSGKNYKEILSDFFNNLKII